MNKAYDNYYQTENLFGEPYPELIEFFTEYPHKGKVLDLGCGQGRDAIPLVQLGYSVSGLDISKIGIEQMLRVAKAEILDLKGMTTDIYKFRNFDEFDFVLADSMFHFAKKERLKEIDFVKKILSEIKEGCLFVVCILDTGKKVEILNKTIDFKKQFERIVDRNFTYLFEDSESGHKSETNYKMMVIKK